MHVRRGFRATAARWVACTHTNAVDYCLWYSKWPFKLQYVEHRQASRGAASYMTRLCLRLPHVTCVWRAFNLAAAEVATIFDYRQRVFGFV